MGSNTTNYNLYKPDVGETGWGDDVNTSTDTVDTTMKANEDAVALNTTHRSSDGTDHANVVLNDTHRGSDGTDHANVVLNDTHRASDGTDHTFIDQDVTSGSSPTFDGVNLTGVDAVNVDIADAGVIITATEVEGALQENRTAINLNTTHRSSDGTDHANVVLNDTHRASDGTDHANVVLNDTHRASDGTDHSNVVLNDTHRASDGTDHSNVVLNDTHRASDGKDHSDVVLNNTHRASSGSDHSLVNSSLVSTINFIIDGGGAAIATGIKGDIEIPFACTINQVTLLADQSTTTTIDIWKDTYANFPATDADSITAAAVPGIAAGLKDQDVTLTGWTTSITAGDILRFNVDANDNAERVTLSLKVTKT